MSPTTENDAIFAEMEDQIAFHGNSLERLMIARSVVLEIQRKLARKGAKGETLTLTANPGEEKEPGKKKRQKKVRSDVGTSKPKGESVARKALEDIRANGPATSQQIVDRAGLPKKGVEAGVYFYSKVKKPPLLLRSEDGQYSIAPAPATNGATAH